RAARQYRLMRYEVCTAWTKVEQCGPSPGRHQSESCARLRAIRVLPDPSRTGAEMEFAQLQEQRQFIVRQRIRLMVNQYEVRAVAPDGSEGELIAFAQQKRLAFKEQVTIYADDTKQQRGCRFNARQVMD